MIVSRYEEQVSLSTCSLSTAFHENFPWLTRKSDLKLSIDGWNASDAPVDNRSNSTWAFFFSYYFFQIGFCLLSRLWSYSLVHFPGSRISNWGFTFPKWKWPPLITIQILHSFMRFEISYISWPTIYYPTMTRQIQILQSIRYFPELKIV